MWFRFSSSIIFFAAALSCSSSDGGNIEAPESGSADGRDGCRSCEDLGAQCGDIADGCGGVISCGTCSEGLACNTGNLCVDDEGRSAPQSECPLGEQQAELVLADTDDQRIYSVLASSNGVFVSTVEEAAGAIGFSRVDVCGGTLERLGTLTLPEGRDAAAIINGADALAANGESLYFALRGARIVGRVPLSGGQPEILAEPDATCGIAVRPNGDLLWMVTENPRMEFERVLYTRRADGETQMLAPLGEGSCRILIVGDRVIVDRRVAATGNSNDVKDTRFGEVTEGQFIALVTKSQIPTSAVATDGTSLFWHVSDGRPERYDFSGEPVAMFDGDYGYGTSLGFSSTVYRDTFYFSTRGTNTTAERYTHAISTQIDGAVPRIVLLTRATLWGVTDDGLFATGDFGESDGLHRVGLP